MKYIIIAYRQYGQWSVTMPFPSREKAERHAQRCFTNNEIRSIETGKILTKNTRGHIKDLTYLEVDLPD